MRVRSGDVHRCDLAVHVHIAYGADHSLEGGIAGELDLISTGNVIVLRDVYGVLAAGDVVEWLGTKSFWLVYLQDLTELAYFRADIRKCAYEIKWQIDGINKSTYAAIKGPTETTLNTI